jgi:cell division protein FtsI/penicillin-binding protein 2
MTALALAAAVVLIEIGTSGKVLRQEGDVMRRVAPGSTIKPFVLLATTTRPERVCGRKLTLGGRRMDCVHPLLAAPVTSREALAYSCNFYFANLAQSIDPKQLADVLRSFGFVLSRTPVSQQDRQLVALGEFGVTTTPMDLARAYARLGVTGMPGLREAVEAGTAQRAAVDGLAVAGKTGTTRGHSWFAGFAPAGRPRVAIVVLSEEGTGGSSAAPQAGRVLKEWFAQR